MNTARSKILTIALLSSFSWFSCAAPEPESTTGVSAGHATPECRDHQTVLPVDNAEVIHWKSTTPNQTLERAHVSGTIDRIYSKENGHEHFEIQIGPGSSDTIEVVYNISFGSLPELQVGMTVEACGDYITSNQATSQYPASPSGAIIHWIHRSNSKKHDSGFLLINNVLYGT